MSSSPGTAKQNDSNSSKPSKPSKSSASPSRLFGAALAVGALLIVAIVFCVICARRKKRKREQNYEDPPPAKARGNYNNAQQSDGQNGEDHVVKAHKSPNELSANVATTVAKEVSEGTFTYEELASATSGFSKENLLGEGTFGSVHKGVLPNGKGIAVKTLKSGGSQGKAEFQAEVDAISRVHYRHLVSLKGYCIARGQRMLVFEFVPNKNLEHHLHGKGVPPMSWSNRIKIAIGIAKGLSYLHEDCHPRIIHRDIKAANVLIDDSFDAKVADFGLAKVTSDNNTHVSTRVMGTLGYLAPEYASSGKLTEKSDVFSFGVMLLEIVSGKRPMDLSHAMDDSLVDWARPLLNRGLEDGNFGELVDPFLEGNYNNQEVARMVACAAASIRHSAKKRPKMRQILLALEGNASAEDLNDAAIPAYNF